MEAILYYKPKVLQAGEFKEALERAVSAVLGSDAEITVKYPRYNAAGVSDDISLDAGSLRAIVDLNKTQLTLIAEKENPRIRVFISFRTYDGVLRIRAYDEEAVQCLERFARDLGLEQTEEPKSQLVQAFETLESRVSVLEKATKNAERTPKCFISFKFDDTRTVAQVDRLKRFLAALHVEWVSGEQFEPRRIEDKVKARLRADVDFVIAVISKAGESTWIRDEFTDANARGLWVVLLLEDGASFDKGIFGTLEYIPYDHAIEQTFSGLLEGINFIKAELSTRVEHRA